MLQAWEIIARIEVIDGNFKASTDNEAALLWSKLAILEAGGWIEECIDKMVMDYLNSKQLRSYSTLKKELEKQYGFDYSTNFKHMWCLIIGAIYFEKIEDNIGIKSQQLESALNAMKACRNSHAHTFIKSSSSIDAPSVIKKQVVMIKDGLNAFYTELMNLPI